MSYCLSRCAALLILYWHSCHINYDKETHKCDTLQKHISKLILNFSNQLGLDKCLHTKPKTWCFHLPAYLVYRIVFVYLSFTTWCRWRPHTWKSLHVQNYSSVHGIKLRRHQPLIHPRKVLWGEEQELYKNIALDENISTVDIWSFGLY